MSRIIGEFHARTEANARDTALVKRQPVKATLGFTPPGGSKLDGLLA